MKSFMLIGLFIFGFTVFSFWGLSTQNNDFMLKIEQLEDNLKLGHRRQKDLEEQLEVHMKKLSESQKTANRLQEDLKQKQSMIYAQAAEGSQWRDKVRIAEAELESLRTAVAVKEKENASLKEEVKALTTANEAKLKEAQDTIDQLQNQLDIRNDAAPLPEEDTPSLAIVSAVTSSSVRPPVDANQVLAKPGQDSVANLPIRELEERNNAVAAPPVDDEVELVDPQPNIIDQPDGAKALADHDDDFNDPNLINSQGDNLEDEPQLVDRDAIRNGDDIGLAPRRDLVPENVPEDQEVENEREIDEDNVDLN